MLDQVKSFFSAIREVLMAFPDDMLEYFGWLIGIVVGFAIFEFILSKL
jgi:hypothetical protein